MPERESESLERLILAAEEALRTGDGKRSMELANQALDEDETCVRAWLIAMKSFQLLLPVEAYEASNEIRCAGYAARFAPPREKYRVRKQIYEFFLHKILEVLKRDREVLADGRQVVSLYQRTVYFDAAHASEKTAREDRPVTDAVLKSFAYCRELFDFIPDSAIKRSAALNGLAAEAAAGWERTCGYLEARFEMYRRTMSREMTEDCLRQYARFLRAVKNREERIRRPAAFNIYRLEQASYLECRE